MLGDDILIGDHRLAERYKAYLQDLDVAFSPLKTHESKTLFEFAKRLFFNGVEITPFPIHAVKSATRFYHLIPVLYNELGRGWAFGEEVNGAIKSYYQIVKGFNAKFCKEIQGKAEVIERLMLNIRGVGPAKPVIESSMRQLNLTLESEVPESACEDAISSSIFDAFLASDPFHEKNKSSKKPLGYLAEVIVMRLTSNEDDLIVA